MARTARTSRSRKAPQAPVTPAKALQVLRTSATKALEAGRQAAAGVRDTTTGAFDSLVKQGAALQSRSRRVAMARAEHARDVACARAEEAKARTVEAVSHLEKVFEQRVSRAISKLGVPSASDVRALSRQVARLQASVEQLHRARARSAR